MLSKSSKATERRKQVPRKKRNMKRKSFMKAPMRNRNKTSSTIALRRNRKMMISMTVWKRMTTSMTAWKRRNIKNNNKSNKRRASTRMHLKTQPGHWPLRTEGGPRRAAHGSN